MVLTRNAAILAGVALPPFGTPAMRAQGLGLKLTASVPKGDPGHRNFLDNQMGYGSTTFEQDTPPLNDTPDSIFNAGQAVW